jgi:hypothetical protein
MKLQKITTIDSSFSFSTDDQEFLENILASKGYKNIHLEDNELFGEKGSNWTTFLIPGDPRRWYHRVTISKQRIRFAINTWYGIFTNADRNVFVAEADAMNSELNGKGEDSILLTQATTKRRISDAIILSILVLIVFIALFTLLQFVEI